MFTSIRRSAIALGAALALLAVVLVLAHAGGVSPAPRTALAITATVPSAAPTPDNCLGCKMSLEIEGTLGGNSVTCDSKTGTVQNPAKCTLEQGTAFAVKIVANSIPPAGYIAWQTFLAYGGLAYKPAALAEDEMPWPESLLQLRATGEPCVSPCLPDGTEGRVMHGDLSALIAPHPVSTHVGPLVELQMNCQTSDRLVLLPLVPLGSFLRDQQAVFFEPPPPFTGPQGAIYSVAVFTHASLSTGGFLQLDIDNDGQLDREPIQKPTPAPGPLTPPPTPAVNDGAVISYPVHTLIEVNCVEPPAPPVGGLALEVDLHALPLDSPHSSTGNWLSPAALATMAFAVIVLGSAAWFARSRWLRAWLARLV